MAVTTRFEAPWPTAAALPATLLRTCSSRPFSLMKRATSSSAVAGGKAWAPVQAASSKRLSHRVMGRSIPGSNLRRQVKNPL
jgi:hypothetical protein